MPEVEKLVLVDEQDQEIGVGEKMLVHQQGTLHRAFSVFVFRNNNGKLELLLQQRAKHKYHCGGLWTNTCCSHPRAGEDIVAAGERRLKEEMLITTKLFHIGAFRYRAEFANGLIEHELDHVLIGGYQQEVHDINLQEAQAFKWFTLPMLERDLKNSPTNFTPWLAQALLIVKQQLKLVGDVLNAQDLGLLPC